MYNLKSVHHRTIQINHQPDATVFQFIILTFVYSSTCFGRFSAHHQELNDYGGSIEFSKQSTCWKIILEPMTVDVDTSEVHALLCVVLSRSKQHVPYGELVWYHRMCNAIAEVSHQPRFLQPSSMHINKVTFVGDIVICRTT